MKYIASILLLVILILVSGCNNPNTATLNGGSSNNVAVSSGDSNDNDTAALNKKSILVGTWQDGSNVGESMGQRYHFFQDGSFIFDYSLYDEAKTTLSESGKWILNDNKLTLEVMKKVTVVGGEKGKPSSKASSDYAIINGKIKIITLAPPQKVEYATTAFSIDNEKSIGWYTFSIEGTQYWKSNSDPNVDWNPQYRDGDIYKGIDIAAADEKIIMIGAWQDGPAVGATYGQRYHFYGDGSYLYETANYDSENRTISESGTWNIANDTLTLIVNSKVTIEGGEKVKNELPADPSTYSIVNGKVKVTKISPLEKKEYALADFSFDKETGLDGYYTFKIEGEQYWRLSDDPDAYHNDFVVKDGDVWNPGESAN